MQGKPSGTHQTSFLMPTLGDQLDPRQPLKQLAEKFPWAEFEQAFGKYYSPEGRPAKSVRLMVGLLLLKQMFNQGDETVVGMWVQNPYWQYFCGMSEFKWQVPCDPSDLAAAAWNLRKWLRAAALFWLQWIHVLAATQTRPVVVAF